MTTSTKRTWRHAGRWNEFEDEHGNELTLDYLNALEDCAAIAERLEKHIQGDWPYIDDYFTKEEVSEWRVALARLHELRKG